MWGERVVILTTQAMEALRAQVESRDEEIARLETLVAEARSIVNSKLVYQQIERLDDIGQDGIARIVELLASLRGAISSYDADS